MATPHKEPLFLISFIRKNSWQQPKYLTECEARLTKRAQRAANLFRVVETENGEIHFAIGALLVEVGQVAEIVYLAVFNNKNGVGQ